MDASRVAASLSTDAAPNPQHLLNVRRSLNIVDAVPGPRTVRVIPMMSGDALLTRSQRVEWTLATSSSHGAAELMVNGFSPALACRNTRRAAARAPATMSGG